jgi:small subunit ribosomal protein S6
MFIINPTLSEEEMKAQIDSIQATIEKNGGEIIVKDDMGSRELAYEIQKHKRGHYCVFYFKAPTESILEIERNYRINESVMRFIVVKYESKTEIKNWTTLVDRVKAKAK